LPADSAILRFAQDRAFLALWFFNRNVFPFRGALAAESAGGSVTPPVTTLVTCF